MLHSRTLASESHDEVRRSSEPSTVHLPLTGHTNGNPTKVSPYTPFDRTSLPPVTESDAAPHAPSLPTSNKDVADCHPSISSRLPPLSLEAEDTPDPGLRANSLPLGEDSLALGRGSNATQGHSELHSRNSSIESRQGIPRSGPDDTAEAKNASQSDMSLSEDEIGIGVASLGTRVSLDEHLPGPTADHVLPPGPLIESPTPQANIWEIQSSMKSKSMHLEPKSLPGHNDKHDHSVEASSLSPLTITSPPVLPSVESSRNSPAQRSELPLVSSPAWPYSQNGIHQPPFTRENALRLDIDPSPCDVVPPEFQGEDGFSGAPVDARNDRSMSMSDDERPDAKDRKIASTSTDVSVIANLPQLLQQIISLTPFFLNSRFLLQSSVPLHAVLPMKQLVSFEVTSTSQWPRVLQEVHRVQPQKTPWSQRYSLLL